MDLEYIDYCVTLFKKVATLTIKLHSIDEASFFTYFTFIDKCASFPALLFVEKFFFDVAYETIPLRDV